MKRCDGRSHNALYLEDFDIEGLVEVNPQLKVGVDKRIICCQIARYSRNNKHCREVALLRQAMVGGKTEKYYEAKYAVMTIENIMICFRKHLKSLPKSTFVECERIDNISKATSVS